MSPTSYQTAPPRERSISVLEKARNPAARGDFGVRLAACDFALSVLCHAVYFAGWVELVVRRYKFGVL
jgi:hypothetical protein